MATNVEKIGDKDNEKVNSRPIRLNKTTNITKIKGWRNKNFNLEAIDNVNTDVDSTLTINTQNCASADKLESNVTSSGSSTDGYNLCKGRNCELLDTLVQKIGDPNDNPFGNISSKLDDFKPVCKEIKTDELVGIIPVSQSGFLLKSEANEKLDTVLSNLPEIENVAFLKSAFVSESLDNFLSGVIKLNMSQKEEDTLGDVKNLSHTNMTNKPAAKLAHESKSSPDIDVVDEYGKKPKTLAEKRRILERGGYPNKMLKIDDKDSELNCLEKPVGSHLNQDDNFRRKEKRESFKRVLRSSLSNNKSSCTNNSRDVSQIPSNVDGESNIGDLVAVDNSQKKKTRKEKGLERNLFKLHREIKLKNWQFNNKVRQKLKEKFNILNKSKMEKAVFIRPLKKRILVDFMPLLKKREIVTWNDVTFMRSIRMIMFVGIGRCLYEEQAENLELLRHDTCVIGKNYAKFATSTVLNRKCPKKIARILLPVVSTKLLTFMKRYNLIKERYNKFLINKFNINIASSSTTCQPPAQSQSEVSILNLNSFQIKKPKQNDNSINNSTNPTTSASHSECNEQTVSPYSFENSNCTILKEVAMDHIKQPGSPKRDSVDNETACDQISEANYKISSIDSSPNCNVKFKKRVLKNGRIFHEDKRITKLNYELRRLNHAFVEIEGEGGASLLDSQNKQGMTNLTLLNDIVPNKLAKVESEFHQTIMKSKEDFVFVSSFGERTRRNRKLPKKLEDAILLSESVVNTKSLYKSIDIFEDEALSKVTTEPTKEGKKLLQSVVQPESIKQCTHSDFISQKPLEQNFEAPKAEEKMCDEAFVKETVIHPHRDSTSQKQLEQNFEVCEREKKKYEEVIGKETVIVQTTHSILKKNVLVNNANIVKNSNCNSSLNKWKDNIVQNNTNKLKLEKGLRYPVLLLKRIVCTSLMRVWCMFHNKYDCPCLSDKRSSRIRNIAVKRTSPNCSYKLDFTSCYKEFIKRGFSSKTSKIEFGCTSTNSNRDEDVINEQKFESDESNVIVPRIENIMSLKPEDFFEDDYTNICGGEDSTSMLSTSCDSQNEEQVQLSPQVQFTGLLPDSKELKNEDMIRTFQQNKNYRFYCVLLSYPFSFIKCWISSELKSQTNESVLDDSADKKTDLFLYIPFNFIFNLAKESIEKKQCVYQYLMNANYDPLKCNNLPFGIYATCKNMVLFGPYAADEPHKLQAFKVSDSDKPVELENQSKSSDPKLIPFVSPHNRSEYKNVHFAVGYWWYVTNNNINNQSMFDEITSKQPSRPVMNSSIVVPVIVPLQKDAKSTQDSNKQFIKGVLNYDKQIFNDGTKTFVNVKDMLQICSSKENKDSASESDSNNLKMYPINFDNMCEETTNMTFTNKKDDCLSNKSPANSGLLRDDGIVCGKSRYRPCKPKITDDTSVKYKKLPIINVRNSQIMSVVYPEEKNVGKIIDNTMKLSLSNVQKMLEAKYCSKANKKKKEPMMFSVQPNGQICPVPLCKIKELGNTSYYCLKNNRKHIIKINTFDGKIVNKNVITMCSKIGGQNSDNDYGVDWGSANQHDGANTINDDNIHNINIEFGSPSNLTLAKQLPKTSKNVTYVDYISIDDVESDNEKDLNAMNVQHKPVSQKTQVTEQVTSCGSNYTSYSPEITLIESNSPSNTVDSLNVPIPTNASCSGITSTKSNELRRKKCNYGGKPANTETKRIYTNTKVSKLHLQKYRTATNSSHGYIPITSDLLNKNASGLPKSNKNLTTKPTDDLSKKINSKLVSLLKVQQPNETTNECLINTESANDRNCTPPAPQEPPNYTKSSQLSEIASNNNDDVLVGFSKSIESIERLKDSRINSSKGVLLKVKFKDAQIPKLNAKKSLDIAELTPLPKGINRIADNKFNQPSESTTVSASSNTNSCSFDYSLSKSVSDIQRKRVVNFYDSPHCSDEVLLIKDNSQQESSLASNYSNLIPMSDSGKTSASFNKDQTDSRIKNDALASFLTSTCEDASSSFSSLPYNELSIDATITPLPPSNQSEGSGIEFVSESENPPYSSPQLLKQTMMKLVKEAKSVSKLTHNTAQDTIISEELKLVSNLDSLPNFLESYGIHFTDDDI